VSACRSCSCRPRSPDPIKWVFAKLKNPSELKPVFSTAVMRTSTSLPPLSGAMVLEIGDRQVVSWAMYWRGNNRSAAFLWAIALV